MAVRVLQVHHFRYGQIIGGVDRVVTELLEGFSSDEVVLFEVGEWPERRLQTKSINGINVYRRRLPTLFNEKSFFKKLIRCGEVFATLVQLKKIIKKENISVVHLHTLQDYHFYFAILAKLKMCKYVVTLHGTESNVFATRTVEQQKRWTNILSGATRITAVSADLAKLAFKNLPLNIEPLITYNGMKEPELKSDTEYSPIKSDSKDKFAISLGALKSYKGHDTTIKAWKLLKSCGVSINLYIAGEGEERKKLEALINELECDDCIKLVGNLTHENALLLLQDATVFVMSSEKEGLGLALIEAMAIGTPIIASNIDVFKEIVVDQESAYIFPVGNEHELAEKVKMLLSDKEKTKGFIINARRRYEKMFTLKMMINKYRSIFSKII